MAAQQFVISDRNPNPGGGCICDRSRQTDCQPPFAIFQGNTMLDAQSPHVVICQQCVNLVGKKMDDEAPVAAGETEGKGAASPYDEVAKESVKAAKRTDEGVKI